VFALENISINVLAQSFAVFISSEAGINFDRFAMVFVPASDSTLVNVGRLKVAQRRPKTKIDNLESEGGTKRFVSLF
jgi:hypothetical protein